MNMLKKSSFLLIVCVAILSSTRASAQEKTLNGYDTQTLSPSSKTLSDGSDEGSIDASAGTLSGLASPTLQVTAAAQRGLGENVKTHDAFTDPASYTALRQQHVNQEIEEELKKRAPIQKVQPIEAPKTTTVTESTQGDISPYFLSFEHFSLVTKTPTLIVYGRLETITSSTGSQRTISTTISVNSEEQERSVILGHYAAMAEIGEATDYTISDTGSSLIATYRDERGMDIHESWYPAPTQGKMYSVTVASNEQNPVLIRAVQQAVVAPHTKTTIVQIDSTPSQTAQKQDTKEELDSSQTRSALIFNGVFSGQYSAPQDSDFRFGWNFNAHLIPQNRLGYAPSIGFGIEKETIALIGSAFTPPVSSAMIHLYPLGIGTHTAWGSLYAQAGVRIGVTGAEDPAAESSLLAGFGARAGVMIDLGTGLQTQSQMSRSSLSLGFEMSTVAYPFADTVGGWTWGLSLNYSIASVPMPTFKVGSLSL